MLKRREKDGMQIGRILKYYRECKGITQTQLAEKANMNEKYYGRVERDESNPTINKLEQICNAIEIEVLDIFQKEKELREKTHCINLV